jgi:WD40 repeat protein
VGWAGDRRHVYVMAGDGNAAALIDVASGQSISYTPPPIPPTVVIGEPAVDVDRQAVFISTIDDGTLVRYDLRTGAPTQTSPGHPLLGSAVALSADGRVLTFDTVDADATGHPQPGDETVRDPTTLAIRAHLPPLALPVWNLWLNHDGSLLVATADLDNHVELWDTQTGHRRWQTDIGYPDGEAIALSPDGRTLVIGTFGGAVVSLDVATGRVLARNTLRLSTQIWSADFAPDGSVVALGGNDSRVHLLTADTLKEIGQLPTGTGATWAFAAYSADGSALSAVDERGHIVRWDSRPQSWIDRACAVVARDLTPDEWNTYLPGLPRTRTCTAG